MPLTNFERLVQLATDVFATKNDPEQLDVDEDVIDHLQSLHPATLTQYDEGAGPVIWLLLIPTTQELMEQFLRYEITEQQLPYLTPVGSRYHALYLCSALVLEEYRRKGITRKLALDAIARIAKDHPIQTLFVWPFSPEGEALAEDIARRAGLPLRKRAERA